MKYVDFMGSVVEWLNHFNQGWKWGFRYQKPVMRGKPSYPSCTLYTISTIGATPQISFEVSVNRVLRDGEIKPTWSDCVGVYDSLRIYGTYPNDSRGHLWSISKPIPHISISLKKTAKQIAADITNRAVTRMIPVMEEVWGKITAAELRYSREDKVIDSIIQILGLNQITQSPIYAATRNNGLQFEPGSEIKVSGNEVVFDLRMPADFALQVCEVIAALGKRTMQARRIRKGRVA